VKFAELYLHQDQSDIYYPTWSASFRGKFQPMINLSPETGVDDYDVYSKTKHICDTVADQTWMGIYFYSETTGDPMPDWEAREIIYAMNACTAN
jgi:hypothetical protein